MKEKLENNKIIKFLEKHEYGVFLFMVLAICSIYYLSYTIHTMPYTNGWGNSYADLIFSGKFPYRDFYYYLPPLNLIIDCILWKLSFGHLFMYVMYRFIERMAIIFLGYRLLCKVSKPKYACIGTILGAIMLSATVYDMIGDYNQTSLLLNMILTNVYFKYIQLANDDTLLKKQYTYLFIGGLMLGISFLHKQTIFLAQCIVFFITLTIYFVTSKKKNYIKSVLTTLAGMLIPISIAAVIFSVNGALIPFIEQVFMSIDAKGNVFFIISSIVVACLNWRHLILAGLLVAYICLSRRFAKMEENGEMSRQLKLLLKILMMLTIYMFILFVLIRNSRNIESIFKTGFSIYAALIIISIILLDFILEKLSKKDNVLLYIFISAMILLSICIIYFNTKYAYTLYRYTMSFALLTDFTLIVTIGGIILFCYLFYSYYKKGDESNLKWIILLASGIVFEYNTSMASANELNNYGLMFLVGVMIVYLLTKICNKGKFIKSVIFIICILVPTTVMAQKVTSAYAWWGWTDTMISSSKFNTINVPGLEGFQVSENVKNMYEEMYKVVKSNSNEKSVIYGFPHIRIFNVLLENTNMNNFVPVPFYDVCSNEYMEKDIELLKNNPPDIIVWIDIPNCIETFERVFKHNEKLAHRELLKWLSKSVNDDKYTLIGQYDSMYIYKLNDGTEINYTYIKNQYAINRTLIIREGY